MLKEIERIRCDMVKHIVMWKLHENAEGNSKDVNARMAKEKLEALNGKVDGLVHLEVGIDYSKTEASFDVILYSELESKKALEGYQTHPEHKAVVPFMVAICCERKVVDYEI